MIFPLISLALTTEHLLIMVTLHGVATCHEHEQAVCTLEATSCGEKELGSSDTQIPA